MISPLLAFALALAQPPAPLKPAEGDAVLKEFAFASGQKLPELRIHYRTLGAPTRGKNGKVNNAVLVLHGTTGSGGSLLDGAGGKMFAAELFGPGQPLDAATHFIVAPDGIGHGKSSKPSDGLRAKFPNYGYEDMVKAQYLLLTEHLKVDHLKLVIGTSMGGMHSWIWGQRHPDFMDALMPLASLPCQISGRNRLWRTMIRDAITTDPEWKNGDYTQQPRGLRAAVQLSMFLGSNPAVHQKQAGSLKAADDYWEKATLARLKTADANDTLYAFEASRDYDPGPGLEKITAPLLAINYADDLINPPELGILEKEIKRVKKGRAVTIAFGAETVGHGTHTKAAVWKSHLVEFLAEARR